MSETSWFLDRLRLSLFAPWRFAAALTREHFGLAGLAVAGAAGSALSVGTDLLLVTTSGTDPTGLVNRLLIDAFLLGVRATVIGAALGTVGALALRPLLRDDAPSIDQLVTAVSFALAPFLAFVPLAALGALAPLFGPAVVVAGAVVVAWIAYAFAAYVRAVVAPLPAAALTFAVLGAAGAYGISDQLDHGRFVGYRSIPRLAPALQAEAATGTPWTRGSMSLVVPDGWEQMTTTIPGTLARFERRHDVLSVVTSGGGALLTTADLADRLAEDELRGVTGRSGRRDIVRIGDAVVVDDRVTGVYEGSRLAVRMLTTTVGSRAYALVFRSFMPADAERTFAEDGAIAVTWRVGSP